MCDLNSEDTRHIVGALGAIDSLAEKVRTHSSSINETAYMDHEVLADLLATLRDSADAAQRWVEAKPQQHAM